MTPKQQAKEAVDLMVHSGLDVSGMTHRLIEEITERAIREAVAAERERCAGIAEYYYTNSPTARSIFKSIKGIKE